MSATKTATTTSASNTASTASLQLDDGRSLVEEAKRLVRLQVRVFYNDECVMLVDTLLSEEKSMRAADLAVLMQLPEKHVTMVLQLLCRERIVHSHSKEEASRFGNAKTTALFYYVNYRDALDTLRWRLYRLKMAAAETIHSADDSYRCPRCSARYGALDVARLLSMRDHLFHCPRDDAVLVESHGDSAKAKALEMRQQLNRLLKPLHDGVKALEGRTLPHVEWPFELRRRNDEPLDDDEARRAKAESDANRVDGIPTISVEILPSDDMAVDTSLLGGTGRGVLAAATASTVQRVHTLPPWLQPAPTAGDTATPADVDADSVGVAAAPVSAMTAKQRAATLSDDDRFMIDSVWQWLRDARGWLLANNVELADLEHAPPEPAPGKKMTEAQAKHAQRMRFLRFAKAHDDAKLAERARFVQEFLRQRLFVSGGDWQVRDTSVLSPALQQQLEAVRLQETLEAQARASLLVDVDHLPDDKSMTDAAYAAFGNSLIAIVNDLL